MDGLRRFFYARRKSISPSGRGWFILGHMMLPPNAPILTAEEMRMAELACVQRGTPLETLMERAGRAVAEWTWRVAAGKPILILCGTGNNGGDGYVAARWLRIWGAHVLVAALDVPRTDLAQAAAARWDGPVQPLMDGVEPRPIVVDALFGVGLTRPMAEPLRNALAPLAASRILAVDVPSGVDADGHQAWNPALPAHITVALGALKPAHVLQPMAEYCGHVVRNDLGEIWADKAQSAGFLTDALSVPTPDAHKFNRGFVLVVSGPMAGAADLAAMAAVRAGAGYVVMRRDGAAPMAAIIAEPACAFTARFDDKRVGAIMIGAGYPASSALVRDVEAAWRSDRPLVLDAAAIDAGLPMMLQTDHRRSIILTPHEGEFQRTFPDLTGNKIERALAAARKTGATILYKGADMVIAAPNGRVRAFWPGSPWLASAGTGDVLAGACAAMLAKDMDGFDAAKSAARWHIAKAQRIGRGLVADDLVRNDYDPERDH